MMYELLQRVALKVDIPLRGLRKGDVGVVVERYDNKGLEVEFVLESGDTLALLTLPTTSVRPIGPDDLPAVRAVEEPDLV